MTTSSFTALVLAGSRGTIDSVARSAGVAHKALAPVRGRPMLLRVIDALHRCPSIGRVALALQDNTLIAALPELSGAIDRGEVLVIPAKASPALTVSAAIGWPGVTLPLLVTTSDHALLTPEIVAHFLGGVPQDADIAVGLASRTTILARYPNSVRTFIRLGKEGYSGCNLFAFMTPQSVRAVEFWVQMERYRKSPWRMALRIGPRLLVAYAAGRLDVHAAFRELSRRVGVRGVPVLLPQAEAAIDIDKPADLAQAERILGARID